MDTITKLEHSENTGVIIEFKPTDFKAGAESAIKYEVRIEDGDWRPHKPTDEWQRKYKNGRMGYDSMTCVTFSGHNNIEPQIMYLLAKGKLSERTIRIMQDLGYFDSEGRVNFSEWFSANVNGTTENGNLMQNYWDSVRKDGLLPQQDGRHINDFNDIKGWLDPSGITQEMRDKAKVFLNLFEVQYEWAIMSPSAPAQAQFAYHLKQSPLHVATPTSSLWNTRGIVPNCDPYRGLNHATSIFNLEDQVAYGDLDHYEPFEKRLAWDYYVPYAIKGVVKERVATPPAPKFTYSYNVSLKYGMGATPEVKALQRGLQTVKDRAGKPYMTPGLFGIYGTATRASVARFQRDNGIIDPEPGENFGPQTRRALSAALLKA